MKGENGFVQALESRVLFSTPSIPRAATVGGAFDAGDRQSLLARLTQITPSTRKQLQSDLKTSASKFDSDLLSYMRNRNGPKFYYDPAGVDSIGSYIKNHD